MRQELQIEQENNEPDEPAPASRPMALTSSNSTASDGERERWVTPEEMKALYPDLCG
jgi:hypothetical protein